LWFLYSFHLTFYINFFQKSLSGYTNIFCVFYTDVKLINILCIARSDFECLNIVSTSTISSVDLVHFLEALAATFCHYQKLVLLQPLLSALYNPLRPSLQGNCNSKMSFPSTRSWITPLSPLSHLFTVFLPLLCTPILTLQQLSALLSEVRDTNNISEHNPLI